MSLQPFRPSWPEYFMLIACSVALRSLDPNTKVGCIIINHQNRIISSGYNGVPSNFPPEKCPWTVRKALKSIDTKYPFIVHAEESALLTLPNNDDQTEYILFTSQFPCSHCAKLIAQKQIKQCYYSSTKFENEHQDEVAITKKIFQATGIKIELIPISDTMVDNLKKLIKA